MCWMGGTATTQCTAVPAATPMSSAEARGGRRCVIWPSRGAGRGPWGPAAGVGGGGTSGAGGTGVGTTGPTETPVLVGGPGDDLLGGGPGDDTLIGGAGNDTYLFGRGSGHDTIVEDDATAGNVDTVQFSADVAPSDVAVTGSGDDLVLSINGSTDQLTVQAFFLDAAHQIEQVSFDDGTA